MSTRDANLSFPHQTRHRFCNKNCESIHACSLQRTYGSHAQNSKVSIGKGLFFRKKETRSIEGFTDANWASTIDDQRSTSGYCTFVWGNLATWRNKKQTIVTRSSVEAEFHAIAHDMCELPWLKQLLQEINVKEEMLMKMSCDNKVTINISHNPIHHD